MNMNLREITLDRRQELRKVPDKLAFLQLERDDGGTVLDVSEGGLRFETFAPVHQNGPFHFWFSLNLRDRIEAWGELVWTNAAKKSGGLRFLRLSEEARAQIREWISQPSSQEAPDEEFSPWPVATDTPARVGAGEPDAVAKFVAKARPQHGTFLSGAELAGVSSTLFPISRKVEATGELVPMSRYLSAKRRQLIFGLLLGIGISATVAVSAIKYSNYRHKNGVLGKAPAESSAPKSAGETLPPVPVSPSVASGSPPDIFGGNNRKTGISGTKTSKILATETGGHPSPNAWEAPASNPQKRASLPLQPSLSGKASQQKASRTPQQLWASVQSGNSKAAVALADLYIKGEGVPQNCNQARVLLLFASEKRNAEAIKRLQELDRTGCPLN
jgi:PilZ domain